ncbi:TrbI/VirB10 family protein [Photobacterium damselae]|uniref:TrbI/VirB10 family protein n=1 Tax=Photobacterium damselae TaxID=38293 RepID=UPI003D7D95D6
MDIKALFSRKESDSLDDQPTNLEGDNTSSHKKNLVIAVTVSGILAICFLAFKFITAPPKVEIEPEPDYEPVITSDFTQKDSLSALQAQQQTIEKMQNTINGLVRQRESLSEQITSGMEKLDNRFTKAFEDAQRNWLNDMDALQERMNNQPPPIVPDMDEFPSDHSDNPNGRVNTDPFGTLSGQEHYYQKPYPRQYDKPELKDIPVSKRQGIQTFSYSWPKAGSQTVYRRTSENYVPTGSFVTAVLIGAADANAGVNAQGDTAPILFRAVHNGILPNGKRSHLKDCFFTASVYGEISSNRGIARLQNMSCIFEKQKGKEEIIDIPVQGTAFNFGRNGMRGTPVMRNGKIMQMAGISGIFSGLGETAKAASSTTVTGTSGVVSSITPSKALLNMSGSALEKVGSKLSDYYIKLAEQYHPIIELNPGTVVNLVFLKGFPLDPAKIDEYQASLSQSNGKEDIRQMAGQLMSNYINPMGTMPLPINVQKPQVPVNNPLIQQLPADLQQKAVDYNQIQQSPY